MCFTLAYGGEHYVLDEVAGVAYALVIVAVWNYRWSRKDEVLSRDLATGQLTSQRVS